MLDARKMVKRLSGYQEIRVQVIRTAGYQVKEQRTEDRRQMTEGTRLKIQDGRRMTEDR